MCMASTYPRAETNSSIDHKQHNDKLHVKREQNRKQAFLICNLINEIPLRLILILFMIINVL